MNTPPLPWKSLPVHDGIEEWMAAALTDGLTEEERRLFTTHLAGCPRCQELFTEQTAMNHALENTFAAVRPLPGFERRLTAAFRLRREGALGARVRRLMQAAWQRPAVRVLGAVAGAVGMVLLGSRLTQESPWQAGGKVPLNTWAEAKPRVLESIPLFLGQSRVRKGMDLLTAPTVTTKSGSKATVAVTHEFTHPTQFQPSRESVNISGNTTTQDKVIRREIPAAPESFEKNKNEVASTLSSDKRSSGTNAFSVPFGTSGGEIHFGAGTSSVGQLEPGDQIFNFAGANIAGANSFTGGTTISGGTLAIDAKLGPRVASGAGTVLWSDDATSKINLGTTAGGTFWDESNKGTPELGLLNGVRLLNGREINGAIAGGYSAGNGTVQNGTSAQATDFYRVVDGTKGARITGSTAGTIGHDGDGFSSDKLGVFLGTVPVGDINVGREVTAGFGELKIPVLGDVPMLGRLFRSDEPASPSPGSNGATPTPSPVSTPAPGQQPGATPAPAATPDARKLIRNASVELEAKAFDPAVDALGAAATQVGGGYVATVDSARLPNGKRRGTVVIKILPDRLEAFLTRLRDLGEVKSQTVAAQDVTKDYFDTEARMRNDRRMEERLLKMLDEAKGKLSEILQVEKELGRVRETIEKAQGELQLYDSLVRFATVTVNLFEKDLQQPATFLLRQTADMSLLAADVEKTYTEARRAATDAHAQIVSSDLARAADGRVSATLKLILTPDTADGVIAKLKTLARVQNFTLRDERVAQNGSGNATDADKAKLERDSVACNLTIRHDEETHRRVSLNLSAADPSAAYDKARAAGLAAGGEMVNASFNRTRGTHGSGTLVLRLPASNEGSLLDTVRALGRTSDLNVQRDSNAAPDADAAPVLFSVNVADEPVRRRVSLTLIAPDLDAAFDKARAAALAKGGEITESSFNRPGDDHGSAKLSVLLPGQHEAAVLDAVRALGRSNNYNVQRDASAQDGGSAQAPVELTFNFADEEEAVQQTRVSVRCVSVDQRLVEIRKAAADAGAQTRSSTLEQGTDGSETASLVFRLPMRAYPAFIDRVRLLGEVKELNVHREDRPDTVLSGNAAAAEAPAEVSVNLYSEGRLVGDESGVGATLRRTLAQGVGALMWSLRMIGVALAFLAPWVGLGILVIWGARLMARRKSRVGVPKESDPVP